MALHCRDVSPKMTETSEIMNQPVYRQYSPTSSQPEVQSSTTTTRGRNKLGYHRTSVACGHCRKRKIRCIPSTGKDREARCDNCVRLKKVCTFYPVDQTPPDANRTAPNAQGSPSAQHAVYSPTTGLPMSAMAATQASEVSTIDPYPTFPGDWSYNQHDLLAPITTTTPTSAANYTLQASPHDYAWPADIHAGGASGIDPNWYSHASSGSSGTDSSSRTMSYDSAMSDYSSMDSSAAYAQAQAHAQAQSNWAYPIPAPGFMMSQQTPGYLHDDVPSPMSANPASLSKYAGQH